MTTLDRYRGCLLGLAAGDALGTTLEFTRPGSFQPLTDMVGGGPFGLKPGEWTDDTSMALCMAESLVTKRGFDPVHQLETYVRWYRDGHLSVKGRCFDIGNATRGSLVRFMRTHEPFCGDTGPHAAGNGSLMRLAPAPLAFANDPTEAIRLAGDSSRTTHAPLAPKVEEIARGSFQVRQPPVIRGSGYVIDTLEAALWAFHTTDDFRSGALAVVNLGEDADTTGAVFGQIAGAYYGVDGIPAEWRAKLAMRELIEQRAAELHVLGNPEK
jgi:ADP-ribosylglycohydrolase